MKVTSIYNWSKAKLKNCIDSIEFDGTTNKTLDSMLENDIKYI